MLLLILKNFYLFYTPKTKLHVDEQFEKNQLLQELEETKQEVERVDNLEFELEDLKKIQSFLPTINEWMDAGENIDGYMEACVKAQTITQKQKSKCHK